MAPDKAFEKQCDEISDSIDNLSEWEVKFYLYCLIPRYTELLTKEIEGLELKRGRDYLAFEKMKTIYSTLEELRAALVYEVF